MPSANELLFIFILVSSIRLKSILLNTTLEKPDEIFLHPIPKLLLFNTNVIESYYSFLLSIPRTNVKKTLQNIFKQR